MDRRDSESIQANMRTPDDLEGEGLSPQNAREVLPGTRFLIVSYGGAGGDALYALKKQLEREFRPEELREKVRILAVDSDETARFGMTEQTDGATGQRYPVRTERFGPREFFWLDPGPAQRAVLFDQLGTASAWLNPALAQRIREQPHTYLDGRGAAGTRQVGRLLIAQEENCRFFQERIRQLVRELTNNNTDLLRIFVLSGIAGGTGSGIVIDASYLIRYAVSQMPWMQVRVRLGGFLLLPPTGASRDPISICKGNGNGYAALKEIDYFMTLTRRGEVYEQSFGSCQIRSGEDLFDACYLVDGSASGVAFSDPGDRALSVLTGSLVEMLSAQPTPDDPLAAADAFLTDPAAFVSTMLSTLPERIAPRDANYIYGALGCAQIRISPDLPETQAARQIVEEMLGDGGTAAPLADLDTLRLPMRYFCPRRVVLIPREAKNLQDFVKAEIAGKLLEPVLVADSTSADQISCYTQLSCLPAYLFRWVSRAERDYERQLFGMGLHMSETPEGKNWRGMPKLTREY